MAIQIGFQILVGFILLLSINFIGRISRKTFGYTNFVELFKSDFLGYNFFVRCLAPSVIVTLVVIILYLIDLPFLVENIWLSVLWYVILITTFLYLSKRIFLIDTFTYFILQSVSILIAIGFHHLFWSKGLAFILPDEANFRTELWVLLLIFVYALLNNISPNPLAGYDKKRSFFIRRYKYLKDKYLPYVKDDIKTNPILRQIFFSIMIVEDFNRGPITRIIERFLHPTGLVKTTGIMQIHSNQSLSDKESVEFASEKIMKLTESSSNMSDWDILRKICNSYNPDDEYFYSVNEVFNEIKDYD